MGFLMPTDAVFQPASSYPTAQRSPLQTSSLGLAGGQPDVPLGGRGSNSHCAASSTLPSLGATWTAAEKTLLSG